MKRWFEQWKRETDGGIVEYVILLSIIGVVIGTMGVYFYNQGWVWQEVTENQYGVALGENDEQPFSAPIVEQPLGEPIITVLPGTDPYTTSTDVKFAATTFGGKAPYTYTWTNYAEGQPDGSIGESVRYSEGAQTVRVKVKDAAGTEKTATMALNITKGLDVKIEGKNPSGSTVDAPYPPNVPLRFDAVPTNGQGPFTCKWEGDYKGAGGSDTCIGEEIVFSESETVNIDVTLCDATGSCAKKQQTITIGESVLQGEIVPDYDGTATSDTFIRFKADVTGGSGEYSMVWTNYSGGVESSGAFGSQVLYPQGKQIIKVQVCDLNNPALECLDLHYEIQIGEASGESEPVQVSLVVDPARESFFTTEDIKFMAMATGGTGAKTLRWTGYSGGSATPGTWGSSVRYTAGTKTITVQACDTKGQCDTQSINITVTGYSNPVATIEMDKNRSIYDVESTRFRVTMSGGTEDLDITWTNYASGADQKNVYGGNVSFPVGEHTVAVKVCDMGIEASPCVTAEKTIKVEKYNTIIASTVLETAPQWTKWSHFDYSQRYWENSTIYNDPTYGKAFKGNARIPWNGTYLLDFDYKNDIFDYSIDTGQVYEFQVYLKSDTTRSASVSAYVREDCFDGTKCSHYYNQQNITLTNQWKLYTFKFTGDFDSERVGFGFYFTGIAQGVEIHAAQPSFDVDSPSRGLDWKGWGTWDDPAYWSDRSVYTHATMGEVLKVVSKETGNTQKYRYVVPYKISKNIFTHSIAEGDFKVFTIYAKANQTTSGTFIPYIREDCKLGEFCPHRNYPTQNVTLTTSWQKIELPFRSEFTNNHVGFGFMMADFPNDVEFHFAKPNFGEDYFRSGPFYTTDQFRAKLKARNGSGQYRVSWSNYSGSSQENTWGSYQTYGQGNQMVRGTVCDTIVTTQPCITIDKSFTVNPVSPIQAKITPNYTGNQSSGTKMKFKVEASGGTPVEDYNIRWTNYEGGVNQNNSFGDEVVYPQGPVTVTAEVCSADNSNIPCKQISYAYTSTPPIDGSIAMNVDRRVFDVDALSFKVDATGGSGAYNVTWTNYAGGNANAGVYGSSVSYTPGSKTVTARICDRNNPITPCKTVSKTFVIERYVALDSNLFGESEVDWNGWGMYSNDQYWSNKQIIADPIQGPIFRANINYNAKGESFIYDYNITTRKFYPYQVSKDKEYDMEIWLRADRTSAGQISAGLKKRCVDVNLTCEVVNASKNVTLTTSWQKVVISVTSPESIAEAGYYFQLGGFANGMQIQAAKPNFDADAWRKEYPLEKTTKLQFKAKGAGGSGEYNVRWSSNYSIGSTDSNIWGGEKTFPSGPNTVTATVCDSLVTSQPCVTKSNQFKIEYDPIDATLTRNLSRDAYDVDPLAFKVDVTGGSGTYNIIWSNYTGGPSGPGTYGSTRTYGAGNRTVTAQICDRNDSELPCKTVSTTFVVKSYPALDGRLFTESQTAWKSWGMFNYNYYRNMYFHEKSTYTDATMGPAFKGTVKNNSGNFMYVFDYLENGTQTMPYSVTNGKSYELEIWLKGDRNATGSAKAIIRKWDSTIEDTWTTGTIGDVGTSASSPISVTTTWKKFSIAVDATETNPNVGLGFLIEGLPENMELHAARPMFESDAPRQARPYTTDHPMQFKTKASGGSGQYSISWNSTYPGSTVNNTWGPERKLSSGNQTVTSTVCDTVVTTQPCVTRSVTIPVQTPKSNSLVVTGSVEQLGRTSAQSTILEDDQLRYKVEVTGGTGSYDVEWEGVVGPDINGMWGEFNSYSRGNYTPKAKVCDRYTPTNCKTISLPSFSVERAYLTFDGQDDNLRLAKWPTLFKGTNNGTVEMWVKFKSLGANGLFHRPTPTGHNNSLLIGNYGSDYEINWGTGGTDRVLANKSTPPAIGQWVHLAIVVQGTNYKIFENGILLRSGSDLGVRNTVWDDNQYFYFGLDMDQDDTPKRVENDFFDGQLSELRVWSTARSDAQIRSLSDTVLTGNEAGLLGYYRPQRADATKTRITDLTGNGNNALLRGF